MIAVSCGQCGKNLQAKPELAGRRVKCPQCGGAIAIPGGPAPGAAPAPGQMPPGGMPGIPAGPNVQGYAMPQMPPPQPAPLAGGSILDMIQDSKLGKLEDAPTLKAGETFCPHCRKPMRMGGVVCTNCGYDFQTNEYIQLDKPKVVDPNRREKIIKIIIGLSLVPILWLISSLTAGWLLLFVVGKETPQNPWMSLPFGIFISCVLFGIYCIFSIVAEGFRESMLQGLLVWFAPGYVLFYVATRWRKTLKFFIWGLIWIHLAIISLFYYERAYQWWEAHPPPETKKKKGK